jgi:hypothetical protein
VSRLPYLLLLALIALPRDAAARLCEPGEDAAARDGFGRPCLGFRVLPQARVATGISRDLVIVTDRPVVIIERNSTFIEIVRPGHRQDAAAGISQRFTTGPIGPFTTFSNSIPAARLGLETGQRR